MDLSEILNHDDRFRYMLLDRLRSDCEYYLGNGNRSANHLWAGSEADQIACMKTLWESFSSDAKPESLPYDKILEYEKEMVREHPALDNVIQSASSKAQQASSSKEGMQSNLCR